MILAYYYGDNKIEDSDKKIKARLKYNNLGVYDKDRVNMLRELNQVLSKEARV